MISLTTSGIVAKGEADVVLKPNSYTTPKYPVIFCHGAEAGPGAIDWMGLASRWQVFYSVVDGAGRWGISSDLGGSKTWGNSTSQSRMDSAFSACQSLGQLTGKVTLVAQSMGATTALAWAAANTSKVEKIILVIPVINLQNVRDNSSYRSDIDNAYGGTYSDGVYGSTHNPLIMANNGLFSAIPIRMFYGDSDALCLPVYATQFAATAGQCIATPLSGGHAESTVASVPAGLVKTFLV